MLKRMVIDGIPGHFGPDGRFRPVIAGAEDPPAPDPKADPKPDPKPEPAKTFTQEELDRVVGERLAREREKYADYDELKQAKARLDEIEAANKSELEKAVQRAEQAEADRDKAAQKAAEIARRAAVIAEAPKQGAVDPDAVVALIGSDRVTVADDGQVTGAEQAVKELLDAKKYLVGEPRLPGPSDGGPRPPAPPTDLLKQAEEALAKGDVQESIRLKTQADLQEE